MTVRATGSAYPGGSNTQPRAYVSPQVQSWARGLEISSARRHEVVTKDADLPRRELPTVLLSLLLALFLLVLILDVNAIHTGGENIDRLNAGIASLESSNALLRSELTAAMNHPVLRRKAEEAEPGSERIVILSAEQPQPEE